MARLPFTFLCCFVVLAHDPRAAADDEVSIGYASVRAAYRDLSARADVEVHEIDAWTVFVEQQAGAHVTWAFAPRGHPAHPVVVRRDALLKNGVPTLVTRFTCEGPRAACERLYARLRAGGDLPGVRLPR